MCGQWGETGVTKSYSSSIIKEELSMEELRGFINDISSFRPNVTLFGGEPLLYKDCVELIEYIKGKGLHCLMITNGSLLKGKVEEIVASGLDELNISLDGDEELHDEIRGLPGVFRKIAEGIGEVSRLKKEYNTRKPLINLQCTMSGFNYRHLEKLVDVAKENQANSLTYHHLIFLDRGIFEKHDRLFRDIFGASSRDWEGFIFDGAQEMDVDYLIEKVSEIKGKGYSFFCDFYPNFKPEDIKEYYANSNFAPRSYARRCLSPWVVAYIFPNGDVRPCLNFDYIPGNIKERGFKDIWNNQKYLHFRSVLKKEKFFPVCPRCTEFYRY